MIPVTYCYRWKNDDEAIRRANLEKLAEAGIKRLVLSCVDIENIILKPELLYIYRRELAQAGLTFVDAHAPWGTFKDPGMPFKELQESIILRHKSAILICEQMGVTSLAYHTGNTFPSLDGIPGTFTLQDYKDALHKALDELLPFAEKHGVVMALENQWTPLNQSSIILEFLEEYDSPFLGFCYDAGHAHLTECGNADPEKSVVPTFWNMMNMPVCWETDFIGTFKKWVVNCHFHSNSGFMDQHLIPDPGNDTMPWDHIMEVLADAPRLQSVQSEVSIPEDCSITPAILRDAFRRISPLLDA